MSDKVVELNGLISQDDASDWVSSLWDKFNQQRGGKIEEWNELRQFLFATDTTTTSVNTLPHSNTTTVPKLTQIRDNLHSNYISSLFPNDDWLSWQAFSADSAKKSKADTIESYMSNKTREGGFRTEISKLLMDYIDFGNAFAMPSFEARYRTLADETVVPDYVGPKAIRISPLDIVFNPLATSFKDTFKIVRSIKTIGEIQKMANDEPDQKFWQGIVDKRLAIRMGAYGPEDWNKANAYSLDGFGDLYEYYMSDYVEILEFYGDYHDTEAGMLKTDVVLTIADRSMTIREETIPSWFGGAPIYHVGWRHRPDNLWAMGPLDNIVGMQYRLDHLENLKSDALDLAVSPPIKVVGEVESFEWAPREEITIDEGGDVGVMSVDLNGIAAATNNAMQLMELMELFAGAPRDAMGIRTPGEKTATEVNQLSNAAGRIFQEKITHFEVELLEKLLNGMLETARRNLDESDVIRITDSDLGAVEFLTITKEDIVANGVIRPIGARHFAKQSQDLQNLIGVFNSPIGALVGPHTSGKELTKFVNDIAGLDGYNIFSPNVALFEQKETQQIANQASEDLEVQAQTPAEGSAEGEPEVNL